MSNIKKVVRCYKCGAILQDEDEKKEGYIVPEVLSNHKSVILMCNDCFKKLIYNPIPEIKDYDEGYYSILEDAKATDSLVVFVLDLFTFEGTIPERFASALGGANVLAVANKRDLFPKNIDDEDLKEYVYHRLRVANLNVSEVILTSSIEEYNIDLLLTRIEELRKRHDVYLIGDPYSGKNSLKTCLLKHFNNKTNRLIATIDYPDTNIRVIEIPLDKTTSLYDVPCVSSYNSVCDAVEPSIANQILFKKQVEPKKCALSKDTSVALGGLAKIDLIKGNKTNVNVYVSDKVECKLIKGKNTDDVFYSMIDKKQIKPISKNLNSYECFDMYDIEVTEDGERDIGIQGLGWFSFKANEQTFRICVPKGVFVYTSRSKIK